MPKFKIEMELQAFKIKIEGDREDAASISHNIGQQMTSLMQPVAGIIEGELASSPPPAANVNGSVVQIPARKTRRRKQTATVTGEEDGSQAIAFAHDPEKFGYPQQEWKGTQKAIWLLHVLQQTANVGELSARGIAETFNKNFKQSGMVQTGNIGRDLGRLKTAEKPPLIGEDAAKTPSVWFLMDAGRKRAQELVSDALGHSAQS